MFPASFRNTAIKGDGVSANSQSWLIVSHTNVTVLGGISGNRFVKGKSRPKAEGFSKTPKNLSAGLLAALGHENEQWMTPESAVHKQYMLLSQG